MRWGCHLRQIIERLNKKAAFYGKQFIGSIGLILTPYLVEYNKRCDFAMKEENAKEGSFKRLFFPSTEVVFGQMSRVKFKEELDNVSSFYMNIKKEIESETTPGSGGLKLYGYGKNILNEVEHLISTREELEPIFLEIELEEKRLGKRKFDRKDKVNSASDKYFTL